MQNYRDGGEAIIEAIKSLGIRYIISSPGSEWGPVWEVLTQHKLENKQGPEYIQCWHEGLSVNIAAGYTLITGKPQAVLLHAGVGLLQGLMSIRSALQAEVPMLVMSGESITLGTDPKLDIEPQWYGGVSPGGADKLVSSSVKWASQVPSATTLYQSILRAGEISQRTPQGPVYLDIALEYMLDEWSPTKTISDAPLTPKTQVVIDEIEKLASKIVTAKNPIIVTELSGQDPLAFNALVELSDITAMPVIGGRTTSFANFPTNHNLWLGIENYQILEDADLVLLIGGRTPWYPPTARPTNGQIICLSNYPHKEWLIFQETHSDLYLEGDIATNINSLIGNLKKNTLKEEVFNVRKNKWFAEHTNLMNHLKKQREELVVTNTLSAISICEAVSIMMPKNTIYVDETISHFPIMRKHLPIYQPQTLFRQTVGGLGQGLGLALGVKLASPDQPVVIFIGDGSFLYNPIIQALGASRDYNLPIIIVVMNNGGYKAMRGSHVKHYPDGVVNRTNLTYGIEISGLEYQNLGSFFGFGGDKVETFETFKSALGKALDETKSGKTHIINSIVPN